MLFIWAFLWFFFFFFLLSIAFENWLSGPAWGKAWARQGCGTSPGARDKECSPDRDAGVSQWILKTNFLCRATASLAWQLPLAGPAVTGRAGALRDL